MEREVKIMLDKELSINIYVNDELTLKITKDKREVDSKKIYESLKIDYENTYNLCPIQEKGDVSDAEYYVLKTFYDLYEEIIKEINIIIVKKDDEETEQESNK